MATTTAAVNTHGQPEAYAGNGGGVQLRHIQLSRVVVPDGFNPRGEVLDDRDLEQMAESIRVDGCLQPIRVRATDHGDFVLISGERRYRAAVKAAVMELPAIIRPAGTGDDDEHADLLIEALLENDLRCDLDPVSRARGYQRLIEAGRTVKGVAERLQTTQVRVRAHLRILKLPEEVQRKVAVGEIPLRAGRSPGSRASTQAWSQRRSSGSLNPGEGYEAYSWADVERAPQDVALAGGELPDGVYRPHTPYPIAAFALSDGAQRDLATVERMLGRPVEQLQFDANDVERARTLGAAHGEGWTAIIVGTDVAADLAADYLARGVKELRQRARAERAIARDTGTQPSRAVDGQPAGTDAVADAVGGEDQAEEVRRPQRGKPSARRASERPGSTSSSADRSTPRSHASASTRTC